MQDVSTVGKFHFAPPFRFTSLDHLVGPGEQRRRHIEAQRLRSLEVNDEIELRGPLHRQLAGLFAFEDAARIDAGPALSVEETRTIAHQPASLWKVPSRIERRSFS